MITGNAPAPSVIYYGVVKLFVIAVLKGGVLFPLNVVTFRRISQWLSYNEKISFDRLIFINFEFFEYFSVNIWIIIVTIITYNHAGKYYECKMSQNFIQRAFSFERTQEWNLLLDCLGHGNSRCGCLLSKLLELALNIGDRLLVGHDYKVFSKQYLRKWYQLSIINCQLSIVNYQLSIINCQLSIINYEKVLVEKYGLKGKNRTIH